MVVEVVKMVEVFKAAVLKDIIKRRDSRTNQIGVEEDAVEEEVSDRTTPTSSTTSVGSMVITRRIATPINSIIAVKWDTLQKIVESKRR